MKRDSIKAIQEFLQTIEDHVTNRHIEGYGLHCDHTGIRLRVIFEYGKTTEYSHNDTNVSIGVNKYDSIFDLLLDCNMAILDKIRCKHEDRNTNNVPPITVIRGM